MLMDTRSLTQEIKTFGLKLGFSHVGIASPDHSVWADRFRNWIKQGFHGEMGYMERSSERRIDPFAVFPEVKSVIVVSMNYYPGKKHRECLDNPGAGYIANYALNEDYHPVVETRLRELLQHIYEVTGGKVQGKIYADAGPILEKAYAVMAGLGWMGKNSLIINPETGSWIVLGVLLLDMELDFDKPIPDRCGECTRCMDACPTMAIVEPYVLDARRCISYILGELKGPIPVEIRPLIGNRVFGCDGCQWVCPWNEHVPVSNEVAFKPRNDLMSPGLMDLIQIVRDDDFKSRFKNSPIIRIKMERFLRNVSVALGNSTL